MILMQNLSLISFSQFDFDFFSVLGFETYLKRSLSFSQWVYFVFENAAFLERLFSVCGLLTARRRNRMDKSLNIRASLTVNYDVLADIGKCQNCIKFNFSASTVKRKFMM